MTITIVSLLDQVLNINLPTYTDYKFFSNLFESNDKGEILTIRFLSISYTGFLLSNKSSLTLTDNISDILYSSSKDGCCLLQQ